MGTTKSAGKDGILPRLLTIFPGTALGIAVIHHVSGALAAPGAGAAGSAAFAVLLLLAVFGLFVLAQTLGYLGLEVAKANVNMLAGLSMLAVPISISMGNAAAEQRHVVAIGLVNAIDGYISIHKKAPESLKEIGPAEAALSASGDIRYPSIGFRYLKGDEASEYTVQYESFASMAMVYSSGTKSWVKIDLH